MGTIYGKLGVNIKKTRRKIGISQEELAEKAKIDPKSIVQIEAGKRNPTLKTIRKIASSLKIKLGDLLD
ncbi:MAG: helix-turn-helix transcriptional regulator [Candidatus Woesebacteria bacterium]|nr:MAG: helix-turn-helix transcriptional regulator [Candidatus Woesebacteria bacterium]